MPVFRYALERWPASPYELLVLHRGPLTPEQQALLPQPGIANWRARPVDLNANAPADLLAVWQRHASGTQPVLALAYPAGTGVGGLVWAARLERAALERLGQSPIRHRLAERLIRGDCAVWVLLESGDRASDDAAAHRLRARLDHHQRTLHLPPLNDDDLNPAAPASAKERLRQVVFSLLRVARSDPAEEVLVRLLQHSEDDLPDSEPLAFPVFGRGRVLYALAGEGITEETIDEACSFLTGPCSCLVKDENPGVDLLLEADWERLVPKLTRDPAPPELPSLATLIAPSNPVVASAAQAPPPSDSLPPGPLHRRLLLLAGLGVGLVAGGTVWWWRSRGTS